MTQVKDSVFIALFTMCERDGWCSPHILPFLTAAKVAAATGDRDIRVTLQHNIRPFDYARNIAAKAFLESGCEWLVMVDNDMAPPVDLLDMLDRADDRMDIVAPKFYSLGDAGLFVCWRSLDGKMYPAVTKVSPRDEWIELSAVGSGLMYIRRRVFERVQEPFFRFRYDENGEQTVTEDYYLCLKASAEGFRIWGNLCFEVDHFKTVSLCALARLVGIQPTPSLRNGPSEMLAERKAPGSPSRSVHVEQGIFDGQVRQGPLTSPRLY